MKEEYVRELNAMRKEQGVPVILYKNICAYAVTFTQNFIDRELAHEYVFQIVKAAIPKVEKKFLNISKTHDYNYRKYAKELVQQTMIELNIQEPRKIL